MEPTLKETVEFFCNVQKTTSYEEAFLKGYLMGLGFTTVSRVPNFELMVKNPQMFIPIEREMIEIHGAVIKRNIDEAMALLTTIYKTEEREVPVWLSS